MTLKIGTRGSQLALWQARTVARLIAESGGPECELVVIRTAGDEPPNAPGTTSVKATFVKEIEDALAAGQVDLAVHSSKDLAAVFPPGLIIGAALAREDPRDAVLLSFAELVADVDVLLQRLGSEPRIGTSSVRRVAQLRRIFPRASFVPLRGNVDTRLRKLDAGECDAAVLASAGLKRLGFANRISLALPFDVSIPAPGQGIVTVQVRDDQPEVLRAVSAINNPAALDALTAERAIVRALGGGCQMPLGAHAEIQGSELLINAIVIAADGAQLIRDQLRGPRSEADALGRSLAEALLERGAAEILGGW